MAVSLKLLLPLLLHHVKSCIPLVSDLLCFDVLSPVPRYLSLCSGRDYKFHGVEEPKVLFHFSLLLHLDHISLRVQCKHSCHDDLCMFELFIEKYSGLPNFLIVYPPFLLDPHCCSFH